MQHSKRSGSTRPALAGRAKLRAKNMALDAGAIVEGILKGLAASAKILNGTNVPLVEKKDEARGQGPLDDSTLDAAVRLERLRGGNVRSKDN